MILNCVFDVWSPRLGDPNLMGWVTVISYFIVALLAFFVLRQSGNRTSPTQQKKTWQLWMLILALLILLGANKQLDLQSFILATSRCIARVGGWYADRRSYQAVFTVVLAISFLIFSIAGLRYFKNEMRRNSFAIIGLVFLLIFIVLRAAAFNHFDAVVNYNFYGVKVKGVLELSGLGFIALQAIIILKAKPQ